MQINTLLFDVGGVLAIGSAKTFHRTAQKYLNLKITDLYDVNISFDRNLHLGHISFAQALKNKYGELSEQQLQHLTNVWRTNYSLNQKVKSIMNTLAQKYNVGIFSNSDPVNSPRYKEEGWYQDCTFVFNSHEQHVLKPYDDAFEKLFTVIDKNPSECLFVDDRQVNIDAARRFGMTGIVFRNAEQLRSELQKQGFL